MSEDVLGGFLPTTADSIASYLAAAVGEVASSIEEHGRCSAQFAAEPL